MGTAAVACGAFCATMTIGRLLADLNARGIGVRDVATRQSSLEDVFLSLLEQGDAR